MNIKDILILQKRELKEVKEKFYIKRGDIPNSELIQVIIGPRRAGKSFFCMHESNSAYVNFDDEQLIKIKKFDNLVEIIKQLYNTKTIFFDEIQNIENWELLVNRLKRQGFKIILSGSNSKLLSKELSSHLTGRHEKIIILPFSFEEFLKTKKAETNAEINIIFESYLEKGGYPEIVLKDLNHKNYIKTLVDSTIYKDVVKRYKIKFPNLITDIFFICVNSISSPTSYNKIKKISNLKSVHTVEKYIKYLEEAFLIFQLNKYSNKAQEQIKSNKKIFAYDNSIITTYKSSTTTDYGKLMENLIAIKLKKEELKNSIELFYYKTKNNYEIDFIIKKGNKISELIQVSKKIDINNIDREVRALIEGSKELNCDKLTIITLDQEYTKEFKWFGESKKIKFIKIINYLIAN